MTSDRCRLAQQACRCRGLLEYLLNLLRSEDLAHLRKVLECHSLCEPMADLRD